MDVSLRRLSAEDIPEVAEIKEATFAPLGLGSSLKREVNNRYSRYLVAYQARQPSLAGDSPAIDSSPEPVPQKENKPADSSLWSRMTQGLQGIIGKDARQIPSDKGGEKQIAGYVGIWFQGNEAHITEIAVREELRGNGIGELLIIGSVNTALENGSSRLTLEARVSNFIAQRLYEKYGFKEAGLRKAYYADNREDAVIMTTSPIHTDEYLAFFQQLQEKFSARWGAIKIDC